MEGIQDTPLTVSSVEVRAAWRRIHPQKAAGPDSITGRALRICSSELADMLRDIFNLSLAKFSVPTCFKATTIISINFKCVCFTFDGQY